MHPGGADVGLFSLGSYANQPNVTTPAAVGGIWQTGGGTQTLGGTALLTLNGATINGNTATGIDLDSNAGGLTINGPLALGRAQQWINNSPSNLNVFGNVANNGFALTVAGSGWTIASGAISGSGGLTVAGPLYSWAANTYTGPTVITASGVLQLGDFTSGSLSTSSAITNNGELCFTRSDNPTQGVNFSPAAISGSGTLVQWGSGTLVLTANNTYSGGTYLESGTLALGSPGAIGTTGTIFFEGGTLQFSNSNTVDYTNFGGSNRVSNGSNQGFNIDTNGQNVTFSGNLASSNGSLTKIGDGTLTLAGSNSYNGVTLVSGGTLLLANTAALSASTFDVTAGRAHRASVRCTSATFGSLQGAVSGSLNLANASGTAVAVWVGANNKNTTLSGALTGSGSLTKIGAGTLALAGSNTFTGAIAINGGVLEPGQYGRSGRRWDHQLRRRDVAIYCIQHRRLFRTLQHRRQSTLQHRPQWPERDLGGGPGEQRRKPGNGRRRHAHADRHEHLQRRHGN